MINEFSRDPYIETEQTVNVIDTTISYLERKGFFKTHIVTNVLDIGRKSPLTERIKLLGGRAVIIDNTEDDLDVMSFLGYGSYDYILYSHTIEHQFNPLHTLLELKKIMTERTTMFIILPCKPKFLWWDGHYHEIDHYRMKMLLKRAELNIVSYERHRAWRNWSFYFTGLRPFIRLFVEYNDYYEIIL